MHNCSACGQKLPDRIETCTKCGALAHVTLAEKQAKKHLKYLQHRDPSADSANKGVQVLQLVPEEQTSPPARAGELIWYVHPQYDACLCLGNVVSICSDGKMMCVEDKWKNTSYTYIEGPWTHIGYSCDCAGCG